MSVDFAAYSIAVVSEDERTYRTRNEANEIDSERVERCGQRILVREEELAEDEAGHRAIEEKVVPLDRGSTVAAITARRSSRLCWSGVSA